MRRTARAGGLRYVFASGCISIRLAVVGSVSSISANCFCVRPSLALARLIWSGVICLVFLGCPQPLVLRHWSDGRLVCLGCVCARPDER